MDYIKVTFTPLVSTKLHPFCHLNSIHLDVAMWQSSNFKYVQPSSTSASSLTLASFPWDPSLHQARRRQPLLYHHLHAGSTCTSSDHTANVNALFIIEQSRLPPSTQICITWKLRIMQQPPWFLHLVVAEKTPPSMASTTLATQSITAAHNCNHQVVESHSTALPASIQEAMAAP